ncbi:hypothetical protein NHX12_033543 [Muraenolepis orangiensis]|uniref:Uncharacterized protein n=1 Tax=Muraenolepis orangiensis TaxID=630683 RepID=A0A9Q0E2J6_9TELE|nr:hypothetical protein NHX12_033543 [Muraenolepis orangiensis]
MEFLKSLVPASISGEGAVDHGGGLPRETGPRLLRMKRLGLLAMGHTVEENGASGEPGGVRPPPTARSRLKGTP